MKVLVALSGGVDSAVAAALLKEQGNEVKGVYFSGITPHAENERDTSDVQQIADALGIELLIMDLADEFRRSVIDEFVQSYKEGRTPNPCISCNRSIKFKVLLDQSQALGYDQISTGHYAIIKDGKLFRGVNPKKDQSYFVSVAGIEALQKLILPLGEYAEKDDVRALAKKFGLSVSKKPDSTDICFMNKGEIDSFLTKELGDMPGKIVDSQGRELGTHNGYFHYTIGQRQGLNLHITDPSGQPRYVIGTNANSNLVIAGLKDELFKSEFAINSIIEYENSTECAVQIRSHGTPIPSKVQSGKVTSLATPFQGVASGQSAVGYIGNQVAFSAVIT